MRRISFLVFFLAFLLSLGAVNLCSAQWEPFDPGIRRWEIDGESGQFWPMDRGSPHWRLKRGKHNRVPISLPKGRVLKSEETNTILGIIKNDFLVNDDTTGGYSQWFPPAVAVDTSGDFVICWQDGRNGNSDIYAQRYSGTGDTLGANFRVNDDDGSSGQWSPSIAMDGDGDFVICWSDGRSGWGDIYAQRYSSSGDALSINFQVSHMIPPAQLGPSVAMSLDGSFVICWYNEHPCGDAYSPPRDNNTFFISGRSKDVRDRSRGFIYSYEIYAQRYSSYSDTLGTNFMVNDNMMNWQSNPSIAMDGNGYFVICWQDKRNSEGPWTNPDIYVQRYNSQGDALGTNFKVNDDIGLNCQGLPAIAMDADGDFVICWRDHRWGDYDIYAQRYNSSGDALYSNFRVNDVIETEDQTFPSIAMDADGNFIICWQDNRNGDWDIYAQRYHSDGTRWGGNYLVNQRPDVPNPDQRYPSVAFANDQIIFTWKDARRSKGWDIYAKVVTWDWEKVDEPGDGDSNLPPDYVLFQNYPNPFNSTTLIRYQVSAVGRPRSAVTLRVYNILGQEVRTLVDERQRAGYYKVGWDGRDDKGHEVASGIYLFQLKVRGYAKARKAILLR